MGTLATIFRAKPATLLPVLLVAFLFSTILGVIIPVHTASADTTPARRLKIYPLRAEISIKPGTAYTGSFTLQNTGTEPLSVQLSAEEFNVTDESYDYVFKPESTINKWVHFATSSIELEPNVKYPVNYVINVPIGTEPGGVYLSLFGASIPNPDASIESVDRVGSLLYVTIPGDITKTGTLLSFSSPLLGIGDMPWSATLRNSGTAHFTTDYSVSLQTLWGTTVSKEESSSLILPRSVRLLQGSLEPPTWLGLYVTHFNIPLGDNGNAVGTRPYLYLPLNQTLPLITLIVGIAIFISTTKTRHKKKKQATAAKEVQPAKKSKQKDD